MMEDREVPAETSPDKNARLRFSLGTMFIGLIILALITSNLFTSWHLQEARDVSRLQEIEIEHLREQLRLLDVSDASQVHIIALETDDDFNDMEWKWRIYVPEGKKFDVHGMVGKITESDFPEEDGIVLSEVGPGQTELMFRIHQEAYRRR